MKAALIAATALLFLAMAATAKDYGQYTNSPLNKWFNSLYSKKGPCCSFADGRTLEDPDWGTDKNGYWVIVDGEKISVPPDALLDVPNKFGQAVVWPYVDETKKTQIRCFIPGAGT